MKISASTRTYRFKHSAVLILVICVAACCGGSSGRSGQSGGGVSVPAEDRYRVPADINDGWTVGLPTDAQRTRLGEMLCSVAAGAYPQLDSLVIVYRGELILDAVFRRNLDQFDREAGCSDLATYIEFSASKSLAYIAIGAALYAGMLDGIDRPYYEFFVYAQYLNFANRKPAITLENVLTMQAGWA